MTDIGDNPFDDGDGDGPAFVPELDNERKGKMFKIARAMKDSCYTLSVAWHDEQWLVVCSAVIFGTVYQSANTIDTYSVADHAELFRMAFANALKEQEIVRDKKTIIMPHGNT